MGWAAAGPVAETAEAKVEATVVAMEEDLVAAGLVAARRCSSRGD